MKGSHPAVDRPPASRGRLPMRARSRYRFGPVTGILVAAVVAALAGSVQPRRASAQPPSPLGPTATAEEVRTYEAWRAWFTQQPVDVQRADDAVVYERY